MIGLSSLPERTPLYATVTNTLDRGAYVVGNLYRPAKVEGRLSAVLYMCGLWEGKINDTYQAHPRWFAQHGYAALVLDPIQLGGNHRAITFVGDLPSAYEWTRDLYKKLGKEDRFHVVKSIGQWEAHRGK